MKYKEGDYVRIKDTDIEGTVESIIRGQLIVNFKGSKIPAWPENVVLIKSVEEEVGLVDNFSSRWVNEFNLPEGYIFKDENGNVINAMKIVLEKKKKEYPKTYEECCDALSIAPYYKLRYHAYEHGFTTFNKLCSLQDKLNILGKLLICRDAYWKIAGEEMGLGKPWEPDSKEPAYAICRIVGAIKTIATVGENYILEFPTEEMRDAFYEAFKKEIEICKELL